METIAAEFAQEKLELNFLLTSGVFHRAPNLAQFLSYVCAKYFEGAGADLKEYNIAVEALGRSPEFDQKIDSIVRVEAHRLRKRLREYYGGKGANHAVYIELPAGQYVPSFHFRQAPAAIPPPAAGETVLPASIARRRGWLWWALGCAVLAGACVLLFPLLPGRLARNGARPNPVEGAWPALAGAPGLRIRAGLSGDGYVDRTGRAWLSDRYFSGGSVFESPNHWIAGARDPQIYRTRREGSFRYDIPLAPGSYEMRLHFAETVYGENNVAGGGESSRVFNVSANGIEILHELDIVSDVGASFADIRAFKDISPASDGKLHLRFEAHSNAPILNAIEIVPGIAGHMLSIRLVAQDRPYRDKSGQVWEPDTYSGGGQLVTRPEPVAGAGDAELYRGERFGSWRYVVPVPPGRYTATFHFAERWFGPGKPGNGGAGSRLFDILIDGVAWKRNVDIYKEAGGADRALTWSAHSLEPSPQGKLIIALAPVLNYACLNALEIADDLAPRGARE
ncbi:MAG: malectin [Acidobacteriia bacterium]|nr:malectin [Terriglobia bacterium]